MKLVFEAAWERAIAPIDRKQIEQLFLETKDYSNHTIIRTAINHKQQLLISVLLHNHSDEERRFSNQPIRFQSIEQNFSIDALVIAPRTSMPWTFIFDSTIGYHSEIIEDCDFEILH